MGIYIIITEVFDMGNMNHEIVDLEKDRSQPDMKKRRISADGYTLCPITSLPSSSNGIQTPQLGCIYIDPVKMEYTALEKKNFVSKKTFGS
jgi:hypothetical protein